MCISQKGIEIGGIESKKYFDIAEKCDRNFVRKVGKIIKFVYATYILQSGIGPILYIITGAPEPNEWFSLMQMK